MRRREQRQKERGRIAAPFPASLVVLSVLVGWFVVAVYWTIKL